MLCDAGAVFVDVSCQIKACVHQHGAGIDGAGLLVLIVRFGVEAAQALHAVTGLGLTHDDGSHHGFRFIRRNELPRAVEVVLGRGDEAVEIALADGMTDADVVARYMEKYPNLKGCFAVNADAVLLAMDAFETAENEEDIVLMGFDAGKEQIAALKNGTIDGLIVQNPFGMGYATVVAAARAALEIGNEATVDTGYVWVDKENMDDPDVKGMLYE